MLTSYLLFLFIFLNYFHKIYILKSVKVEISVKKVRVTAMFEREESFHIKLIVEKTHIIIESSLQSSK